MARYAAPRMRSVASWLGSRLLWVVLLGLLGACSKSDASASPKHSKPSAAAEAEESAPVDRLRDLEARDFPLLIWAAHTIDEEYFDTERFDPVGQLRFALTRLGLHTPEFFARVEPDGTAVDVRVGAEHQRFELGDIRTLFDAAERMEEILVYVRDILELEEDAQHELEYAAINGMFAPLDPHTVLLTPDEHADLGVRTKGEFGGIGAQIRAEGRRIVIVRVLPNMPADLAGVEDGDVVLSIDGERTVNMSALEAQKLLRGPVGTEVKLELRRGKKTLSAPITRKTITIDSVVTERLPDDVAYIQILAFQENTAQEVRAALDQMGVAVGKLGGIVLDLRGNSGGLLTQATEVVDLMVDSGELVIVRSALGREADPATESVMVPPEVSVVVLIDEESASAAEIVGGGLGALGRAVVLGRSSFGKGTVQMIRPASPYGRELALKLTVAEYLVAGDRTIQSVGVMPDLLLHSVELSSVPGIVRYYDEERFERARERSQIAGLPSAKHEVQPNDDDPPRKLHYLWSTDVPEAVKKMKPVPEHFADPEVRIAHRVARALRGETTARGRRTKLQTVAGEIHEAERERIEAALAEDGIDWSAGTSEAEPKLHAELQLVGKGGIEAGKPFEVRVVVANRGETAAHRVHAITDCVHDELDGIEVMLGELKPGQSEERTLSLHVMPWHSDFTGELRLDVHAGIPDDEPDARGSLLFRIDGPTFPSLSFDAWIVDDPRLADAAPPRPKAEPFPGAPPFSVEGNGDGILQPSERVLLAVVAHNEGTGRAPDVRAVIRNLSGSQGLLEEGMVELGPIEPGGRAAGSFGITMSPEANPALPFELDFIVGDATLRTSTQNKYRFAVVPEAPEFEKQPGFVRALEDGMKVLAGAHRSARVLGRLTPGTVVATSGQFGGYRVVEDPKTGRRYFLPEDAALQLVQDAEPQSVSLPPDIRPPTIELTSELEVTQADRVRLEGLVHHPEGVRDVAVLVRPPGPGRLDDKIHYEEAGEDMRSFPFSVDVPLEPGGNRITILARDRDKVQRRRDVWVFRRT